MTSTHAQDPRNIGQNSADAVLTAKAAKVLRLFISSRTLGDKEIAVLSRTASLLGRIVQGSLFVENRKVAGFAPSHVGLAEYERALTAAEKLDLLTRDNSVTDLFVTYQSTLVAVAGRSEVPQPKLTELKTFLSALSRYFSADLLRPASEVRTPRRTIEN